MEKWPDLVPLALYFIRMTLTQTSGFFSYKNFHGWEPPSPVDLLYQGRVDDDLKELDILQWVRENMEVVQDITDRVTIAQTMNSGKRKKKLDKRAVLRSQAVGDSVLLRTPGLDSKLVDSWEGPYFVKTKLGAVTYELDVGKLKTRIAHINSLRREGRN